MTRILPLLIATLIATPSLAGGIGVDLPHLTFPDRNGPATQACADPAALTLAPCKPSR